jgi:DNA mismatch repair protein MutH
MKRASLPMVEPPRHEIELLARARGLVGRTIGELSAALGRPLASDGVRTKGKAGDVLERALGASAGSTAQPDFPHLGVELKSIPVDESGRPRETTFVCAFDVATADTAEWATSWARAKLSHVLWIPVLRRDDEGLAAGVIGSPVLWRPTAEQDSILGADFDELMGIIGVGGIERLTARDGRWLQVRPKAADGTPRAVAFGPEGERIATVAKGFYLRTLFTGAILRDAEATP